MEYQWNSESLVAGPNIFAERFSEMGNMTDEEIYSIIRSSYSVFFSSAIDSENLLSLRRNSRFLMILTQVLMEVELTLDERIYCNSMIYKELANTDNPYMQKVYYTIGWIVNQNIVQELTKFGLSKTLSIYLATVRKSSFKARENISRLNFSIMCSDPKIMTVQMITNIYCVTFNTIDEIKDLFILTMKDTYVFHSTEEWVTPDLITVANNMNYAILSILDSLPVNKIKYILTEYSNMATIEDLTEDEVRFSFKLINLSEFSSLKGIVDLIISEEMILP